VAQQKDIAEGAGKTKAATLENKAKSQPKTPKDCHFAANRSRQKHDGSGNEQRKNTHANVGGEGKKAGRNCTARGWGYIAAQPESSFLGEGENFNIVITAV
jgi:hypothetical protein